MKLTKSQIKKMLPSLHTKAKDLGYVGSKDNGKKILNFLIDEEVTVKMSGKALDLQEVLDVLESAAEQVIEMDASIDEVEVNELETEEEDEDKVEGKSLKTKPSQKKLSDAVSVKVVNRMHEIYKKKIASGRAKFQTPEAAEFYGALARKSIFGKKEYSMKESDAKILDLYGKANTGDSGSEGGFLYNEEFWPELLELRNRYGKARQLSTVRNGQRDKWDEPVYISGPTVYKPGQATAITASDLVFDQINLVGETYATLTLASRELINSSQVDFADEVFAAAFDAHGKVEDSQFFGEASVLGKQGYRNEFESDLTLVGIQLAAGENYADITKANIDGLIGKLRDRFQAGASFVTSRSFYFDIMVPFLDTDATLVEMENGLQFQWRGIPVVFDESGAMPSARGETDEVQCPLILGDFSFARILTVNPGMELASDESYAFNTNSIAYRTTEQRDFAIDHTVGDNTEAGSVVGLIMPVYSS